MKNKFLEILDALKRYQECAEEIKKIDDTKNELLVNSKYCKKLYELSVEFSKNGIIIDTYDEPLSNKPYEELLAHIEKLVNNSLSNSSIDYDESELFEYYNGLTSESRNRFADYEDFKKQILKDYANELENQKRKLNNLVEQFKIQKKLYDEMEQDLQQLNSRRITLLNERWSLLEKELKNSHVDFLNKGIESSYGFPVIKDDIEYVKEKPRFDKEELNIDDLVMVHATDYFPQNGVIKTSRDSIGDKRNTIHTALNGRVSSHMYGNWDNCSIIILDPLKEHIDQIDCIYSVDTFTYGSVQLSDKALILIDINKFDDFYNNNKEYIDNNRDKVILYSGNSTVIVEKILNTMGYVSEGIGQWGWDNKYDNDKLNAFVNKYYPNKLNTSHDVTPHHSVEKGYNRYQVLSSFGIKDDGNDMVISLDILYALREYNKNMDIETFIKDVGVFVNDNEIHLLGIKDHINLLKDNKVSPLQVEKIELLLKKYEMMKEKDVEAVHHMR